MGIQVGDNFDHKSKKPLDARTSYTTLALMKAVTDANMNEGCLAYCAETDKYYKFLSTNEVDETLGKWREFSSGSTGTTDYTDLENKPSINEVELSGDLSASDLGLATETDLQEKQEQIQYTSMPTASEDLEGAVYQYLGATTSTYTHGHWYECVSDGEDPASYSWEEAPNYEEMEDSDMDDVVTPLPSVSARYHKYSTEEQVVGEWIDGSTIYEKTIEATTPATETNGTIAENYISIGASIDKVISIKAVRHTASYAWGEIPLTNPATITTDTISGKTVVTSVSNRMMMAFVMDNNASTNSNSIRLTNNNVTWNDAPVYVTVQYTKTTD